MTAPTVRPATVADAAAIAAVHVAGWRTAYDELVPAAMLAALSVDDRTARWAASLETDRGVQVAEVDGVVAGFASVGACRDGDASDGDGELFAIYVDPAHWSTGAGHALHEAAMAALTRDGYARASLWVLTGNDRAIRFYERHGWTADGTTKDDVRGEVVLRELRMRRPLAA